MKLSENNPFSNEPQLIRACHTLQRIIAQLAKTTPKSREISIALTHAETALLWLNKATHGGLYRFVKRGKE